jgi:hypothetical protein
LLVQWAKNDGGFCGRAGMKQEFSRSAEKCTIAA